MLGLIEEKIIKVMKEDLKFNPFGMSNKENFLEAGISSIDFIKMLVKLELEFCIEFEDEYLNINMLPTMEKLIKYIDQAQKDQYLNI